MKKLDYNWYIRQMSDLKALTSGRKAKYLRNYRYYNNTPRISLENIKDPTIVGYFMLDASPEDDTTITPSINIIKSCIDTLTSKMAESKVRPFFNTINGTYKDQHICRQTQQCFDQYFDYEDCNKKVAECFRDCAIFDTGWIYIDEVTKHIYKALPWQVYFRPAEMTYNKLTRIYYERTDYPVTLLPDEVRKDLNDENIEYVRFGIYYDIFNHTKAYYCSDTSKLVFSEPYESDELPFVYLHYSTPVFGNTSLAVSDMLYSIQLEINQIMAKIKDASQLNPANTYFVPDESNIKVSQINNRIGNIIKYRATPNMTSSPITVSTPPFIDNQYIEILDKFIEKGYEMVGISALSASSKKPTGVDSGIALTTLEDTESERFETQLNQVIKCYIEIAKKCIAVFPTNANILPESTSRVPNKWKDIVEETDKMVIQKSSADALSKDPAEKLKELQSLAQAGIIPASRVATFLEIPDINSGFSLTTNAINAVLSVIDDCLKNDNFDIPVYIPYDMLEEEILNTQLSLRSANYEKNKKDIDKLSKLYDIAEDEKKKWMATKDAQAQAAAVQSSQAETVKNGGVAGGQNVLEKEVGLESAQDGGGWDGQAYNQQGAPNDSMTTADNQGGVSN